MPKGQVPVNKCPYESQVLALIRSGHSALDIAGHFGIAITTVRRIAKDADQKFVGQKCGRRPKIKGDYTQKAPTIVRKPQPEKTEVEKRIRGAAHNLSNWPSARRYAW